MPSLRQQALDRMTAEAVVKRGERVLLLGQHGRRRLIEMVITEGPKPEVVITELETEVPFDGRIDWKRVVD